MLPHVQAHRDELTRAGQDSSAFLECTHCLKNVSRPARASWHCGYLPKADRKGYGFNGGPGTWPPYTVCPGYTTSLPQVFEVARARMWWDKGCLQLLHKRPTDALLRGIEVLQCAASQAEADMMQRARKPVNGSR